MNKRQGLSSVVLIGIVLFVVIGGVVGAALGGLINIPGLTPKKGKQAQLYGEGAAKLYGQDKKDALAKAPTATKPSPPRAQPVEEEVSAPVVDPAKGAKKLASLWSELSPEKVRDLSKDWRNEDLAPVLAAMDEDKAAKIIALVEPLRASKLSKEIQRISSKIPPPVE